LGLRFIRRQEFAMKLGILGALVVLAVPLAAAAQSPAHKKADLEEALRVRQYICNGIAQVRARGGSEYSDGELAQCLARLAAQHVEYQQFMAAAASAQPAAAASSRKQLAGIHPALAAADR
jgi:hypothetical protein